MNRRLDEKHREPRMGEPGYYPDHAAERRVEFTRTTPGERVAEAIELSRVATQVAVLAALEDVRRGSA